MKINWQVKLTQQAALILKLRDPKIGLVQKLEVRHDEKFQSQTTADFKPDKPSKLENAWLKINCRLEQPSRYLTSLLASSTKIEHGVNNFGNKHAHNWKPQFDNLCQIGIDNWKASYKLWRHQGHQDPGKHTRRGAEQNVCFWNARAH